MLDDVHLAWAHTRELDPWRSTAHLDLSLPERRRLEQLPDGAADDFLLGRHLLRTLVRAALRPSADGPDRAPTPGHAPTPGLAATSGREPVVVVAICPRCGGDHGRPELPGTGLVASIAHAGGLVAVAVATASVVSAIGIDVEPLPRDGDAGLRSEDDAVAHLQRWTRYEAVMKAEGTGVVDAGSPEPPDPERWPTGYRISAVEIPGFAAALATRRTHPSPTSG